MTNTQVLIFKTNIETEQEVKSLESLFDQLPFISRWTVDTEDIDCVMRVVSQAPHTEQSVRNMVCKAGFQCEVLEG